MFRNHTTQIFETLLPSWDPDRCMHSIEQLLSGLSERIPAPCYAVYQLGKDSKLHREQYFVSDARQPMPAGQDSTGGQEAVRGVGGEGEEPVLGGRLTLPGSWQKGTPTPTLMGVYPDVLILVPLQVGGVLRGVLAGGLFHRPRTAKKALAQLGRVAALLSMMIGSLMDIDTLRREALATRRRVEAERDALSSTVDASRLIERMLWLASQATGFVSAFLADLNEQDELRLSCAVDLDPKFPAIGERLDGVVVSVDRLEGQLFVGGLDMETLDSCGVRRILLLPVEVAGEAVAVVGLVSPGGETSPSGTELTVLEGYAQQLSLLVEREKESERFGESYLSALETINQGLDMLTPATRGHHARVGDLARRIALAHGGLSEEKRRLLDKAAALHDVGLYPGRDGVVEVGVEFAHPQLGADLVSPLPGGADLALIISEHHETWDGMGFPAAKPGEVLSLEGQILAAAEHAVELTTRTAVGRSMSYGEAADRLRDESGRRLSEPVADAASRALSKMAQTGYTRCYELKSCPESIRKDCPAAGADAPCWTVQGVSCALHGDDDCADCLIYLSFASNSDDDRSGGGLP